MVKLLHGSRGYMYDEFKYAFAEIFDNLKESVTYHTIAKSWDTNDDLVEAETDSTVYMVIEIVDASTSQEFAGLLNIGDMVSYTDTIASVGDKFTHNSIKYKISKVIPMNSGSTVIFYEIHAKRT